MQAEDWSQRIQRNQELLHSLVRRRGLRKYTLFDVTAEGKELPGGFDNASGYVLDESGRLYSFWLDLDDVTSQPKFTEWEEIPLDDEWKSERGYQQARLTIGLA